MHGTTFVRACQDAGVNAFFGVPCSFLADAFAVLEAPDINNFWPAPREDVALGAAAGAALAGKMPAVLMQNSGLGVALNAVQSLLQLYGLPCLLVVSWRGAPQAGFTDAPEHIASGANMLELLRLYDVPVHHLDPSDMAASLRLAITLCRKRQAPVALVVQRGLLDRGEHAAGQQAPARRNIREVAAVPKARPPSIARDLHYAGSTEACMASIIKRHPQALVIACNGLVSREACAVADRPENFYMLGSMGLAASIGLGAALSLPRRQVVVLEGDGNALMGLGTLAMVGQARPRNFWHVVLDNGVHRSTGNQRTVGAAVDFATVALACGYVHAQHLDTGDALPDALGQFFELAGPSFAAVRCPPEPSGASRVRLTPHEITQRVRAALQGS